MVPEDEPAARAFAHSAPLTRYPIAAALPRMVKKPKRQRDGVGYPPQCSGSGGQSGTFCSLTVGDGAAHAFVSQRSKFGLCEGAACDAKYRKGHEGDAYHSCDPSHQRGTHGYPVHGEFVILAQTERRGQSCELPTPCYRPYR